MKLIAYTDGAARGAPGLAGGGIVILDAKGKLLIEHAEFFGVQTSNQAEYLAALWALQKATELGCTELHLSTDSMLVVRQLSRRWKVRHPNMRELVARARIIEARFPRRPVYHWIPRARNGHADRLSNDAIDWRPGRAIE